MKIKLIHKSFGLLFLHFFKLLNENSVYLGQLVKARGKHEGQTLKPIMVATEREHWVVMGVGFLSVLNEIHFVLIWKRSHSGFLIPFPLKPSKT